MKRVSLIRIIAALRICCAYIFTCGIMGVVDGSGTAARLPVSGGQTNTSEPVTEPAEDEGANGQGTLDFFVPESSQTSAVHIELMNFQQPPMADRVIFTSCSEIDLSRLDGIIPEDEDPLVIGVQTEEVIVVPDEEPEPVVTTTTTKATTSTTKATTTTAATTTATTTTTTITTASSNNYGGGIRVDEDVPVTSSVNEDIPDEPDLPETDEDAANEILYVLDNGELVSGNALDITSRITQTEVGYTFAPEAIKAQAVAAYTYVKYYNYYGMYPNVVMSSSVSDSVRVLVASVIGDTIYYNGDIIQSVYSASSAGYTASSLATWGNDYPYLVSKYCELDEQYDPNYGRTASFSSDEIKSRIYNKTGIELSGDPSQWITVEDYVEGKYVGQMNIGGYHSYTDGNGDSVRITGRVFRERIMEFGIRSHAFEISYDEASDTFTVTTYGYGHGVGMSQNGAHALATYWGWDYKQILEFYYTDCKVY